MSDYVFDKSIFYLLSNVPSVNTSIVKEQLYINKIYFFTAISKNAVAYITLIETNISNNIIKQCYDIMKTLKVLITVS